MSERQRSWKPPTAAEKAKKKAERVEQRRQTLKENLREKVLQWCKDYHRPYHGSTAHREGSDGNQLIEKKKSGGHTPLNAAVEKLWKPGKLKDSRDLFGQELYWLMAHRPDVYGEMHALFFSYGCGDSDYDELRKQAETFGYFSTSAEMLRTVDYGVDLIVRRLVDAGVKNADFWADLPLPGVTSDRTKTAEDKDRERYLVFEEECRKRHQEKMDEYAKKHAKLSDEAKKKAKPPKEIRVRNRAIERTADRLGVSRATIERAVQKFESGYIREEAS